MTVAFSVEQIVEGTKASLSDPTVLSKPDEGITWANGALTYAVIFLLLVKKGGEKQRPPLQSAGYTELVDQEFFQQIYTDRVIEF